MRKTLLLLVIASCSAISLFGQFIPYGLQLPKVQKEIIKKTSEFDSLVLIDRASYWHEDYKAKGFGFKDHQAFKVTVIFKKGKSSFYDINIDKIEKDTIVDSSLIDSIKKTNYSAIADFSNDSLNYKPNGITISDQIDWTALIIRKSKIFLRQAYAPEFYQRQTPTKEREAFMAALLRLEELWK